MITSVLEIVKVSPFFKRPITTLALVIGVFAKSAAIHVKWGDYPVSLSLHDGRAVHKRLTCFRWNYFTLLAVRTEVFEPYNLCVSWLIFILFLSLYWKKKACSSWVVTFLPCTNNFNFPYKIKVCSSLLRACCVKIEVPCLLSTDGVSLVLGNYCCL